MENKRKRRITETSWGFECAGCGEWYPHGKHQACAGAADGLPKPNIKKDVSRIATALERIAAQLEDTDD